MGFLKIEFTLQKCKFEFWALFSIFFITADDGSIGSDEELQRVLANHEFDFTAEDMGQVLGGLGKVDDTMLR